MVLRVLVSFFLDFRDFSLVAASRLVASALSEVGRADLTRSLLMETSSRLRTYLPFDYSPFGI